MKLDIDRVLFFEDKTKWHEWLEQNHDKAREALLLHYKKGSHNKSVSHLEAIEEALSFGWIDSILKSVDSESFMLKYTPRKPNSVWSKINKDKAEQLIAQGKMTDAGMKAIKEAMENGNWDNAYTSLIKDTLPSDLKQTLMKNKKAWYNFQKFATTYRNMYTGWLNSARTEATRQKRIAEILYRSEKNIKPGIDTKYYHLIDADKKTG